MKRVSHERALWLVRHIIPHEASLRSWLSGRNLGGLEPDDVIQEAYARLMTLESTEAIRNSRNYFFQTAHSVVLNHLRRLKIVTITAIANVEDLGVGSEDPTPETAVADRDELRKLAVAIAEMPAKIRSVFTLRRVEGQPQREVARTLQISESTVEKRLSRALSLLASSISDGKRTHEVSKLVKKEIRTFHASGDRSGN